MEELLIFLGIYIVGVFIAIIEIAYINAKGDEDRIDVGFSLLSWLITIVALGNTINIITFTKNLRKMKMNKNKVMITIIIIVGVILSVFPVSQIIKECSGQKPRIEKLESPSSINNPFKKDCITDINIFMRKDLSGEYCYYGYVNFENGYTKGEQKFKGESLEDVYNQIYQFCEGL